MSTVVITALIAALSILILLGVLCAVLLIVLLIGRRMKRLEVEHLRAMNAALEVERTKDNDTKDKFRQEAEELKRQIHQLKNDLGEAKSDFGATHTALLGWIHAFPSEEVTEDERRQWESTVVDRTLTQYSTGAGWARKFDREKMVKLSGQVLDDHKAAIDATADRNEIAKMARESAFLGLRAALTLQAATDQKSVAAIQDQLVLSLLENLPLINKLEEENGRIGMRHGVGNFMIYAGGGSTPEIVTAVLKGLRDHRAGEIDKIIASLPNGLGLELARDMIKLGHN